MLPKGMWPFFGYQEVFQLEKPFIMTCHSDKSEQEQKEYYAKSLDQSWMFVPFGKPVREFLKLYKLHGLPSVKLIDNDGSLVEEEVKKQIEVGHQKGKAGIFPHINC
jgi:hypothetical protein